jgi:hypothetical protein
VICSISSIPVEQVGAGATFGEVQGDIAPKYVSFVISRLPDNETNDH